MHTQTHTHAFARTQEGKLDFFVLLSFYVLIAHSLSAASA